MKVSYISNQVIPSKSAESIFVAKSCDHLVSNGCDVDLLCPMRHEFYLKVDVKSNYSLINWINIKLLPFPKIKGKYLIYHFFVLFHLLFNRPDVAYSRTVIGAFVALLLKIDTVLELHSLPPSQSLDGKILKIIKEFKSLKLIVCISSALKLDIKKFYEVDENKLIVEHDATDITNITHAVNQSDDTSKKLKLGYVGSLYPGKGMEIISELSHLINDDVSIIVYGGSEEEINSWKSKCSNNVEFKGYIPYSKIFEAISKFDVCLLPNQPSVQCAGHKKGTTDIGKYTSPMKMFDYMSAKKPIIASDLPILREILKDDFSYFSGYDNPNEWKERVYEILENRDESIKKSMLAFDAIKRFYNWDFRVKRILKEIEKRV